MDINVKRNAIYNEVLISYGNATISTGLLDRKECREMALKLLIAAEDLLPEGDVVLSEFICKLSDDPN